MTDPKFYRMAQHAAEELDVDAVVIVAFNRGSLPHIVGYDHRQFGATPGIADALARFFIDARVVVEWLVARDWDKSVRRKT